MTKPTHLDLGRPVDLRRVLAWFEAWTLPDAAEKLLARVAAGEAMTLADLRVDVWGPLGADGSPAHAPLHDLLLQAPLLARPAVAAAVAVRTWHLATADEGIPAQAARIARAALLWEADGDELARVALADGETADRLARAWMRHGGIFLASDALAPVRASVPPFLGTGTASVEPWHRHVSFAAEQQVLRASLHGSLPADLPPLEPWLDARDDEIPASVTVDGVPWLSARLADYLRAEFEEHGAELAADWLENERTREAKRSADQPTIPGLPPHPPLAGWLAAVDVPDLGNGWGVSPAALALARAVWWAEVRPGLERAPEAYPTSAALFPVAVGMAAPTVPGRGWETAGVDVAILALLERTSTLETVQAQALLRALPNLARIAANNPGAVVDVRGVHVTMGTDNRTSVHVPGGWSALAAALGVDHGDGRKALKDAAYALSEDNPLRWAAHKAGSAGSTHLLMDPSEAPDGVRFALPRILWPGFAAELRTHEQATTREIRRLVPIPPDMPPTTNRNLGAGPSRLELDALAWLRNNLDAVNEQDGGPIPWAELADKVGLSGARQAVRRRAVLATLLELWEAEDRWHRTGDRWRPAYGWAVLLEAKKQRDDGKAAQARKHAGKRPRKPR
jgi:hypothetical protein